MDITVYLPDELGQRAKGDPDVNLSRMLRDALTDHYAEEDAVDKTLEQATEIRLDLEDGTVGRFTGTEIGMNKRTEGSVYLAEDGRVIAYHQGSQRAIVLDGDLEELLPEWLEGEDLARAADALGVKAIVEL